MKKKLFFFLFAIIVWNGRANAQHYPFGDSYLGSTQRDVETVRPQKILKTEKIVIN